jgi:1-phosphofructokinase family hexose kinase
MILTVTLNPLLEKRLIYKSIELGKNHRAEKEFYSAGGKGINVSRQLNFLGVDNSAFTFIGGNNGKIFRHILTEEKIDFSLVSTKSEMRSANLVIEEDKNRITTFFGLNSEITIEEVEEFKSKLEKMIINCSTVVFSGSSPCKAADSIFPYGIELANKHDKVSVLDSYGDHLEACLNAAPTVIHNNVDELEKTFGISLQSEEEKITFMKKLYSKNIKLIFLTDGANPAYAFKFGFIYKITPPEIKVADATGSGDAFVAGIIAGMEKSKVFDEFIKDAAALGAANAAKWETCTVSPDELESFYNLIQVETIGKKMKIIDDSPNY